MKLFKSTLAIVAFFAIGSVNAKGLKSGTAQTKKVTTNQSVKQVGEALIYETNVSIEAINSLLNGNTKSIINYLKFSLLNNKDKKMILNDIANHRSASLKTITDFEEAKLQEEIDKLK